MEGEIGGARGVWIKLKNINKISVQKPEQKRALRRPRHRWGDNIKMNCKGKVCVGLILLRSGIDVNAESNEPSGSLRGRNFLTS
jgi:hypothetical protein